MNRIKKFFQTTESRNGSYSVGITVLVLVIVIILKSDRGTVAGENTEHRCEQYQNL